MLDLTKATGEPTLRRHPTNAEASPQVLFGSWI